jgi:hypothetical protein
MERQQAEEGEGRGAGAGGVGAGDVHVGLTEKRYQSPNRERSKREEASSNHLTTEGERERERRKVEKKTFVVDEICPHFLNFLSFRSYFDCISVVWCSCLNPIIAVDSLKFSLSKYTRFIL